MQNHDTGMAARGEPDSPPADLSLDEAQHLGQVRDLIARHIAAAGGWLGFDQYMEIALYEPGLGYYSAGAAKLGAAGDFTTAPEISALFGRCIARRCEPVLRELSGTSILELGAGTGRMAVDVLGRLAHMRALPDRYLILEVSADLRARQQALLAAKCPEHFHRIRWLDALPDRSFDGIVLANEVLDALPVQRFRRGADGIDELGVASDGARFVWRSRPAPHELADRVRIIQEQVGQEWPPDYVGEICMRMGDWTTAATHALRRGVVLWIDYGLPRPQLYLPERSDGTLLSHFRHRAFEDPFLLPGLSDITAWVDFTALAEAGAAAGFDVAGFTTQAHFLAGAGIEEEMRLADAADALSAARLSGEVRRLMLPGEMGERFKVMTWSRGLDDESSEPAELLDLRHTL